MNKHPKPLAPSLGKGKKPPHLQVWVEIWSRPTGIWCYKHGERFDFKKLDDARAFAKKHGYDGIRIAYPMEDNDGQ